VLEPRKGLTEAVRIGRSHPILDLGLQRTEFQSESPKHHPEPKTLVHITCRTINGLYLFRPGPEFNDVFLGVLGKAQRDCGVELCAVSVLSTHFHLLSIVDDVKQAADFMRNFKSKLALETNRMTGWSGPVFDRRYEMAVVTDEEAAQVEVLKYILAQGVKEQLVEWILDWPGVHSFGALLEGTPLTGHCFDRSQEHAARVRGEEYDRLQYATVETVTLSPAGLISRRKPTASASPPWERTLKPKPRS